MKCTKFQDIADFIFGDIEIGHTETETEIYKENAILIRTRNGFYVDIECLTQLEIAYLYLENTKHSTTLKKAMGSHYHGYYKGELFVKQDTLKLYVPNEDKKNISLLNLKKGKA